MQGNQKKIGELLVSVRSRIFEYQLWVSGTVWENHGRRLWYLNNSITCSWLSVPSRSVIDFNQKLIKIGWLLQTNSRKNTDSTFLSDARFALLLSAPLLILMLSKKGRHFDLFKSSSPPRRDKGKRFVCAKLCSSTIQFYAVTFTIVTCNKPSNEGILEYPLQNKISRFKSKF